MACCRGRRSRCSRPGYGIALLEEITTNPTKSHQNLHRTGETEFGGHKQSLVCTSTWEKGAVTTQETDPDMLMSVQESLAKVWVGGGLL